MPPTGLAVLPHFSPGQLRHGRLRSLSPLAIIHALVFIPLQGQYAFPLCFRLGTSLTPFILFASNVSGLLFVLNSFIDYFTQISNLYMLFTTKIILHSLYKRQNSASEHVPLLHTQITSYSLTQLTFKTNFSIDIVSGYCGHRSF